jgi:5'-3' exonuclease
MTFFSQPSRILAIDVSNLAHRCYHRFKHLSIPNDNYEDGQRPTGHIFGVTNSLLSMWRKHTVGDHTPIFWFAVDREPTRRLRLYPDYKGNRPERSFEPVPEVEQLVRRFPGVTMEHPNLEADDIMACMAHPSYREDRYVVLVTNDRDLWKFVGRRSVGVWLKDHIVEVAEVEAEFGVTNPKAIPLVKSLFGDETDNIKPAVPRVRRAPILNLIEQRSVTTLEQFKAEVVPHLPQNIYDRFRENWGRLKRNWEVVKLPSKPLKGITKHLGPKNPKPLVKLLQEFRCKSLYEKVEALWP